MWRRRDEMRAGLLLALLACSWTATRADLSISLPAFPTGDIATACVNTAGGSDWDAESFTSVYSADVGGNDHAGTVPLGTYGSAIVTASYCTGTVTGTDTLPLGSYCVLQTDQGAGFCPVGFAAGSRTFKLVTGGATVSEPSCGDNAPCYAKLPRLDATVDGSGDISTVTMYYCCREDSAIATTPLNFDPLRNTLPDAFVLLRKGGKCQAIAGRTVKTGWILTSGGSLGNLKTGSVPDGDYTLTYTRQHYCAYDVATVPLPVTGLTVTGRTESTLSLSWTSPAGAAMLSLYVTPAGGVERLLLHDATVRSTYTAANLSPATSYSVRIAAGNAHRNYERANAVLETATCPIGYTGADCLTPVCLTPCEHGACSGPNQCTCHAGYTGTQCDRCAPNYYLSNTTCVACASCEHGFCRMRGETVGTCVCEVGWTGALCDTCAPGFHNVAGSCVACPSECTTCDNNSTCTACVSGFTLSDGACEPSCGDGAFMSNGVCVECQPPCSSCRNLTLCTSCVSSSVVLQGAFCVSECDVQNYVDADGVCQPCDLRCSTCTGSGPAQCLTCARGRVLQDGKCVTPDACELSGGFVLAGECIACDASCERCSAADAASCTACPSGKVKQGGACRDTCDAGYTANAAGTCIPCTSPCATCTAPTSTSCASCVAGFLRHGSRCVTACPAGYFAQSGACVACDSSCGTCTGSGASQCTSCSDRDRVLHGGACIAACPSTHFANADKQCAPCDAACATCEGAATYCTSCTSAPFAHRGSCGPCPTGTFDTGAACMPCDAECAECDTTASSCTVCADGLLTHGSTCISAAACAALPGSFINEATSSCDACDASCATCAGTSTQCTSCSALNDFLTTAGACVAVCPAGTYGDTRDGTCRACTAPCATCTSASSTTCNSCLTGGLLGTLCRTCPAGTFNNNGVCTTCHASCRTCSGSTASDCTSCASGNMELLSGSCTVKCASNQFVDSVGACVNCESDCTTCSGSAGYCTSCANAGLKLYAGDCLASCPAHTIDVGGVCAPCDASCSTCTGPTYQECATCPPGLVWDGARCLTPDQCVAESNYVDGTNCIPCHISCRTCDGPGADKCTACSGPGMVVEDGTCVASCLEGQYAANGVCVACLAPCATCTSATSCLSCTAGTLLDDDVCVSTCRPGTFASDEDTCLPCVEAGCMSCSDGAHGSCLACEPPLSIADGRCFESCDEGTYSLTVGGLHLCVDCPSQCATCTSPTACTACASDAHVLRAGQCIDACSENEYIEDGECKPCDGSCRRCFGPSATQCSACDTAADMLLLENACVSQTTCAAATPIGHFVAASTCPRCHSSCASCSDATPTGCTSCAPGMVLQSGTCRSTCAPGYYLPEGNATCAPCSATCATCNGTASACTACASSDLVLDLSTATCVGSCPAFTFAAADGSCQPCHDSCSQCSGPSPSECLVCASGADFLDFGYCSSACLPGTIGQLGACASCHETCLACTGSRTNCSFCAVPSDNLYEGACMTTCPDGFYSLNQRCVRCHPTCATCTAGDIESCITCADVRESRIASNATTGRCVCPVDRYDAPNTTAYLAAYQNGLCLDCSQMPGGCTGLLATGSVTDLVLAVVVPVVVFLGVFLFAFFHKRAYPQSAPYVLLIILMGLYDSITDVIFAVFLAEVESLRVPFILCCTSLAISFTLNMGATVYAFGHSAYHSPYMYHFFERNKIVSGMVGLCSIFCMEFLFFLSSRIFNLKALSLNWPTGLENRIGALGVLTTICEDLPQLALQIYVSTQVGMSTVLLLSLVASGTALLVSLLRRIVLVVISRHQTRHTGFLSPDDKAFGLENSGKTITNELATLPRRPEPHRSVVILTE